ncbi:MAG: hypothetical protein QM802_14380 [Agriterribacter sp.]
MNDLNQTPGCPMAKLNNINADILKYVQGFVKKRYKNREKYRAFHAKTIGLVKAKLIVKEGLDEDLSVGLFSHPNKYYDAWIRFSNANNHNKVPDINAGVRGMAIKILLPATDTIAMEKETSLKVHDIILTNNPTFFPSLPNMQLPGAKAGLGSKLDTAINFVYVVTVSYFVRSLNGLRNFFKTIIKTPNILEEMYFSATPYAFGEGRYIKWHVRPYKTIASILPEKPTNNFLRERLIDDLLPNENTIGDETYIEFGLFVQFHENKETEPLDDSGVEWKTTFYEVATLRLPKQYIDTEERKALDKEMSFSPGRAISAHRPCGSVNAIRTHLYEALAKERIAGLGDNGIKQTQQP